MIRGDLKPAVPPDKKHPAPPEKITTNNNKNDIKVNNNFSLTLNFGDSLNLLAIIVGIYFFRKLAKKYKGKKVMKEEIDQSP